MAISTTSFNVHLHPAYYQLQENAYQNKGQEGYAPMSLRGREVLEGQVVALKLDIPSDEIPWIAYPDAAGMPKNPVYHAEWMHEVRWAVNQRTSFLDQTNQLMDVTIVPATRETVLHTGSNPVSIGDLLYLRFPTDADVQAQQSAFRDSFSGYGGGSQMCPPMFATYGVQPQTVDHRGRMFSCMDRYRRFLTTDQMDFDVTRDGGEGTIAQIESSKVTRITRLLSFMHQYFTRDGIGEEIRTLAASIKTEAVGEETMLKKCRESNVFKTTAGVQFTSEFLAMLCENDTAMYDPNPFGEVLQSLEPTGSQCIFPGDKMVVKLFKQ